MAGSTSDAAHRLGPRAQRRDHAAVVGAVDAGLDQDATRAAEYRKHCLEPLDGGQGKAVRSVAYVGVKVVRTKYMRVAVA